MQEMRVIFLGQEDSLEKEMATHSSILAWEISWTEEPGGLQSIGCKRVGHDLAAEQQWTDTKASTLGHLILSSTWPVRRMLLPPLFHDQRPGTQRS